MPHCSRRSTSPLAYGKERAGRRGNEIRFGMTANATLLVEATVACLMQEKIEPLMSRDGL